MTSFLIECAPLFSSTLSDDFAPVISAMLMSSLEHDEEWITVQRITDFYHANY
jgi:hypothetical protein